MVLVQPKQERAWLLLGMSALVASVVVSSSLAGYTAIDRLKVPVDAVALAAAALALYELWFVVAQILFSIRQPAAAAR
jgi:hypothetical protein